MNCAKRDRAMDEWVRRLPAALVDASAKIARASERLARTRERALRAFLEMQNPSERRR